MTALMEFITTLKKFKKFKNSPQLLTLHQELVLIHGIIDLITFRNGMDE